MALAVLGDTAVDSWMTSEHVFLGGNTPQEALVEENGPQDVTKLLMQMAFCGFS